MKQAKTKPKAERIQIVMRADGVETKRIIEINPGNEQVLHEGVLYERTAQKVGLHGHPGASQHPMVAVFVPSQAPPARELDPPPPHTDADAPADDEELQPSVSEGGIRA